MTIGYIATYRYTDGEILWVTDMKPEEADHQVAALPDMFLDWVSVDGRIDTHTNWVVGGVVTPRPVLAFDKLEISADDVDVAVLDAGETFTAVIDGIEHTITGGLLEISSPMPASYQISIRLWPYQDFDATVVAS